MEQRQQEEQLHGTTAAHTYSSAAPLVHTYTAAAVGAGAPIGVELHGFSQQQQQHAQAG
jgi:hypothetical protein